MVMKIAIFNLIEGLQRQRRNEVYFPLVMYSINLLIHLLIYLFIPTINVLHIANITTSILPIIILASFILILLLQATLLVIKNYQFYLTQQLSLFRFIVSPMFTLLLLVAMKNNEIGSGLGVVLVVVCKVMASVVSRAILYEIHRNYTLNIMETSIIQ